MLMPKIDQAKMRQDIASGELNDNPYIESYRLVAEGAAAMLMVLAEPPGSTQPEAWATPVVKKPTLFMIGDDLDDSFGPSRFHQPSIVDALKLCGGTVLQVANFQPDVMTAIALRLRHGESIMVVECRESTEKEWADFLHKNGAPNMLVVTTDLSRYVTVRRV